MGRCHQPTRKNTRLFLPQLCKARTPIQLHFLKKNNWARNKPLDHFLKATTTDPKNVWTQMDTSWPHPKKLLLTHQAPANDHTSLASNDVLVDPWFCHHYPLWQVSLASVRDAVNTKTWWNTTTVPKIELSIPFFGGLLCNKSEHILLIAVT